MTNTTDGWTNAKLTWKTDQCTTQMIKHRYLATNLFYLQYASNIHEGLIICFTRQIHRRDEEVTNHTLKQIIDVIVRRNNLYVKVSYLQCVGQASINKLQE